MKRFSFSRSKRSFDGDGRDGSSRAHRARRTRRQKSSSSLVLYRLLPMAVVVAVVAVGFLSAGTATKASASTPKGSTHSKGSGSSAAADPSSSVTHEPFPIKGSSGYLPSEPGSAGPEEFGLQPGENGAPKSGYPTITFKNANVKEGYALFQANCASCHGPDAAGTEIAPNLQGLGAATIDFWVSTGRMPLANADIQAAIKPRRLDPAQTHDVVAWVTSLDPGGPGVPLVDLSHASLAQGQSLFTLNCAGCHTITGAGDALSGGAFAPTLHIATPRQVAEAIRTGPGNMPRFGPGNLSTQQVDDIVAYVTGPIQHPDNPGGFGLGGIGPVAEGFVALLIGVGGLMLIGYWIGDRT